MCASSSAGMCSKFVAKDCVARRRPSGVDTISSGWAPGASAWASESAKYSAVPVTESSVLAQPPAGASATTDSARPRAASWSARKPPSELPAMCAVAKPASSIARSSASGSVAALNSPASGGPPAWPASVGASTSCSRSSAGRTRSQVRQVSVKPCTHSRGVPEPPRWNGVKRESTEDSVAERDAVFAGLAAADEHVVAHEHGLPAAEPDRVGVADGAMAAPRERGGEAVERFLEGELPLAATAGVESPARLIERGLGIEAAIDEVGDDLQMALGLHVSPHDAERPEQRAIAQQQDRDDRVVRALARREPVGMAVLEREAVPAVVQRDARPGRDHERPERVVDALDQRAGIALLVDRAQVARPARPQPPRCGRARPGRVDQRAALREVV